MRIIHAGMDIKRIEESIIDHFYTSDDNIECQLTLGTVSDHKLLMSSIETPHKKAESVKLWRRDWRKYKEKNLDKYFGNQESDAKLQDLEKIKDVDAMLAMSKMPKIWKCALVKPLHKKGSKDDPQNYRPISNLCSISKMFERMILTKLNEVPGLSDMDSNPTTVRLQRC